ncbi:hypothetical protein [Methanosphaerula palustris]|uniref:Uncharacterized protein n=1 Tax=Methanosphaerula palustris (strain ATCC BAA-1556 / DSM 19958 / E1-9c) TaxID=521011 RepID=B8GHR8_METPE|nr:hypothetical protein [Methanosphaerula palustris]ACL16673.1 hypothetical protein Mpal_1340 [Methanosphaerula palustris E1-9c]
MERSTLLKIFGFLVVLVIAITVISYLGLDGGLVRENLQGVLGSFSRPPP